MAYLNQNYLNLEGAYLFSEIAKRVAKYTKENPDKKVIRLGIGDVTLPLVPAVIEALHKATDEMAAKETFKGYGPEQGYDFLKAAIIENDYKKRGIDINPDEVFVSDGAKSDMGNIGDILSTDNIVGISDPVYPVYVDTNIMAGRRIKFLNTSADTGFVPQVPDFHADVLYICSPNNPTGTCLTKTQLAGFVKYAKEHDAIILFDAAYESFIKDPEIPHSIYEVEGAKEVAIEFRSFSKTAGFTGLRCGFCVIPHKLLAKTKDGRISELNPLWNRRHTTKFNGTPYIVQKAAAAVYTAEGQKQIKENINYYQNNADIIKAKLKEYGIDFVGGVNAPYIWLKCNKGLSSWGFFDELLSKANVVGTPGAGFGKCGEGWFRLTAFGDTQNTKEAMERFKAIL